MKAMLAGFAALVILAVAAWYGLNAVDYTEAVRIEGTSVRVD